MRTGTLPAPSESGTVQNESLKGLCIRIVCFQPASKINALGKRAYRAACGSIRFGRTAAHVGRLRRIVAGPARTLALRLVTTLSHAGDVFPRCAPDRQRR
jgi:hypothetical protein